VKEKPTQVYSEFVSWKFPTCTKKTTERRININLLPTSRYRETFFITKIKGLSMSSVINKKKSPFLFQ